jgi:glycosyltransferase involved in cell wall biosynthesis
MLIWKTNSFDVNIASVRYRCLLPSRYLEARGYQSCFYHGNSEIDLHEWSNKDVLIFVKSFTPHDLCLSEKAQSLGIPVILDICDNIFIGEYASHAEFKHSEIFAQMSQFASAIVTTGHTLKHVIQANVKPSAPIFIIPDANETIDDVNHALFVCSRKGWMKFLLYKIASILSLENHVTELLYVNVYRFIQKSLRKKGAGSRDHNKSSSSGKTKISMEFSSLPVSDEYKTVVWFGNHGANYGNFGMLNLLDIVEPLKRIYGDIDFRLLVVSNSYTKYRDHIQSLPFPTSYVEWDLLTIHNWISESDVAIIPNSKSDFSICKSANRALLSLALGVPVVATRTPALEEFSNCIMFDDWEMGLRAYLNDSQLVSKHLEEAQSIIRAVYSGEMIAKQWSNLIEQVVK